MALVCVNGCKECTGCMACQSLTLFEEAAIERIEDMNNARRKKLQKIHDLIEEIYAQIEDIMGEEEEARDNVPESLQGGDLYEAMEDAISNMEDALSSIEEASSSIEEACA